LFGDFDLVLGGSPESVFGSEDGGHVYLRRAQAIQYVVECSVYGRLMAEYADALAAQRGEIACG
jgi:hypothetical protein